MANDYPLILVHGLFGYGPGEMAEFPYWGTGRSVPSPLPRYEASVGPISSTHDRACELAWQIKGGRVDYGQDHASAAGHARHGRTYEMEDAFHPQWSEQRPVHLVGHSMGGPTIWMLQQLLADDFFGWGSSERWIASISSISGVLNGSTATYFLGCDEQTGLLGKDSAGGFLARTLELFLRATGGLFDRLYDFDLDHWGIEAQQETEALKDYTARIAASPMFWGKDNAAYSVTVQGLFEQNLYCRTFEGTHYFSYVTEQTFESYFTGHHLPEPDMNPLAIPSAIYIGRAEFDPPLYAEYQAEEWWPNDGLVSVYSQEYPRIAGDHPTGGEFGREMGSEPGGEMGDGRSFEPGRWYHQLLEDTDHVDIVALPELSRIGWQKRFYMSLFQRLAAL